MSYFTSKNETLTLFSRKKILRAYICCFFVACELLSKYHYSLIPFVGRIMFRRHPPFLHSSPSHNFFAKSFVVSNNICTFVTTYSPPRFPLEQRAQGESFLFFLPCSVFSYSINAEEDRSDIDKFVLNHIIIGKQ